MRVRARQKNSKYYNVFFATRYLSNWIQLLKQTRSASITRYGYGGGGNGGNGGSGGGGDQFPPSEL